MHYAGKVVTDSTGQTWNSDSNSNMQKMFDIAVLIYYSILYLLSLSM